MERGKGKERHGVRYHLLREEGRIDYYLENTYNETDSYSHISTQRLAGIYT